MIKKDFVKAVAARANFTAKDTAEILDAIIEVFNECVDNKEELSIAGWFSLTFSKIKPRRYLINPGEKKTNPEAYVPKFRFDDEVYRATLRISKRARSRLNKTAEELDIAEQLKMF